MKRSLKVGFILATALFVRTGTADVVPDHKTFEQVVQVFNGQTPMVPNSNLWIRDRGSHDGLLAMRLFLGAAIHGIGFDQIQFETYKVFEGRDDLGINIIFEIPGVERPKDIILIGANYDSDLKDRSTGVASVLAIAETMKAEKIRPARTIRFVLFDTGRKRQAPSGSMVHFFNRAWGSEHIKLFVNPEKMGGLTGNESRVGVNTFRNPLVLEFANRLNRHYGKTIFVDFWSSFITDGGLSVLPSGEPNSPVSKNMFEKYASEGTMGFLFGVPSIAVSELGEGSANSLVLGAVLNLAYQAAISSENWDSKYEISVKANSINRWRPTMEKSWYKLVTDTEEQAELLRVEEITKAANTDEMRDRARQTDTIEVRGEGEAARKTKEEWKK